MPDATLQAEFARNVQEQVARDNAAREEYARRVIGAPWDVVEIRSANELDLASRAIRHI